MNSLMPVVNILQTLHEKIKVKCNIVLSLEGEDEHSLQIRIYYKDFRCQKLFPIKDLRGNCGSLIEYFCAWINEEIKHAFKEVGGV